MSAVVGGGDGGGGTRALAPVPSVARGLLPDPAGLDVVDLGCGTGDLTRWFADRAAASVLGLDLSVERLATARGLGEPPAVRFEQADLEQLRLTHASYDLAWCAGALRQVVDPLRLARTVNAGLRPGGSLVVVTTAAVGATFLDAATTARLDVRRVERSDGLLAVLAVKRPPGPLGRPGPDPARTRSR